MKAKKRDDIADAAERIFVQSRSVETLAREFLGKFRMLYKVIFSFRGKVSHHDLIRYNKGVLPYMQDLI